MSDSLTQAGRIMVLDDEPLIAMATEQMILEMGHAPVDAFYRLEEAENACQSRTYAVAILDVNVDANQSSLKLAADLRKTGTRIVFATGDAHKKAQLQEQSDFVIDKPFGEADLQSVLEKTAI